MEGNTENKTGQVTFTCADCGRESTVTQKEFDNLDEGNPFCAKCLGDADAEYAAGAYWHNELELAIGGN